MWYRPDIFTGPTGTGQYVPNVNDLILDYSLGLFRVTAVNATTNLSTLVSWSQPDDAAGVIAQDILLGSGPGTQSESYRCYINGNVTPKTLAIDSRLRVYGSRAAYCKVFLGTDISASGIVISAQVNSAGQVISENLSMEPVGTDAGSNLAIRTPIQGYSTEYPADGEVVTAVIYESSGRVLSISKLLVKRTNFVRTTNASRKYITSIQLVTPFISSTDNHLIEYPTNMLFQVGNLKGQVNYSDGTSIQLPIDGSRFILMGAESYVATQVGQRIPLLLTYNMASNEYGYSVNGDNTNRFVTADYEITTTEIVGAYNVKLFVVPVWQSPTLGYKLEYYLYNLDRQQIYYATPYVTLVAPYNTYNPLPNGNSQTLSVRIELSSLGSSFAYYNYAQTFTIALLTQGTATTANWWIRYSPGGVQIGGSNFAVLTNTSSGIWSANIAAGKATQQEWLDALYHGAEPLLHPLSEIQAPTPTHFRVKIGTTFNREIAIANWAAAVANIPLTSPDPKAGDALRIEFIKKDGSTVYELGLGVMAIHRA